MKNNSISRILVTATHAMVLCFLLASGVSALAQSANGESGNGRCSNRTLNGSYGFPLTEQSSVRTFRFAAWSCSATTATATSPKWTTS